MEGKDLRFIFSALTLLISPICVWCQPQAIILKGERVVQRFQTGDSIKFKVDQTKGYRQDRIDAIWEFGVITANDSVWFSSIRSIYSGGHSTFASKAGQGMILAGAGYFLIDQINQIAVSGNRFSMEKRVWKPAAGMLVAGTLLSLLKKRWYRLENDRLKLKTVTPNSIFYLQRD